MCYYLYNGHRDGNLSINPDCLDSASSMATKCYRGLDKKEKTYHFLPISPV